MLGELKLYPFYGDFVEKNKPLSTFIITIEHSLQLLFRSEAEGCNNSNSEPVAGADPEFLNWGDQTRDRALRLTGCEYDEYS